MIDYIDYTKLSISELRNYKIHVLDKLKSYQRLARKIDKEIKNKFKNGEIEDNNV